MPLARKAAVVLIIVAAFLRLYRLDHYPLPMHQDEVSDAYDAYSIVQTGADRTGSPHPFVLRGLGAVDYRPALYAWLAAVPMSATGFSPTAARLPSAILGVAALLLMFLFARELVSEKFALIALAVGVFSPWHLTYSRLAHQGAMLPAFFAILALWLWQRAAVRNYPRMSLAIIGLVLGLSANAYQTTRLIAPLILLLIAFDHYRNSSRRTDAWLLIVGALIGAAPQIFVLLTEPDQFFARLVSTVPSATQNSPSAGASALKGLKLLFGPRLLFWPNMDDTGYLAMRLLLAELPFYYIGFFALRHLEPARLERFRVYVYIVLAIALLPAVITANSSSIRVTAALPILPLWTAAGMVWSVRLLERWRIPSRFSYGSIAVAMIASIAFTAYMYFGSATVNGIRSDNAMVQIGERLKTLGPRYDRVFVVDSPEYAALHVAAFSEMHPAVFQKTRTVTVDANGWDYITSVGNLRFLKPRQLDSVVVHSCAEPTRDLFVSRTRLPSSSPFDSVSWHTDKYYFTNLDALPACRAREDPAPRS